MRRELASCARLRKEAMVSCLVLTRLNGDNEHCLGSSGRGTERGSKRPAPDVALTNATTQHRKLVRGGRRPQDWDEEEHSQEPRRWRCKPSPSR